MGEIISIIAGIIALAVMFFKRRGEKEAEKKKEIQDADNKIDSASNASDIMRGSD